MLKNLLKIAALGLLFVSCSSYSADGQCNPNVEMDPDTIDVEGVSSMLYNFPVKDRVVTLRMKWSGIMGQCDFYRIVEHAYLVVHNDPDIDDLNFGDAMYEAMPTLHFAPSTVWVRGGAFKPE